jgi:plasmid maintenance system antidote protein VapI
MKTSKRQPAREDSPLIGVLKETIRDCGLPMSELAKRTGVSHPQLSRFVRGERTLTLPAAERLVQFFRLRLVGPDKGRK